MTDHERIRTHPRHQLDDALMTPLRFSMMAALVSGVAIEIDFATLRDIIETDDSALSKAVSRLQNEGYVVARKGYVANKPRTWLRATSAGATAFGIHSSALQAIVGGALPC